MTSGGNTKRFVLKWAALVGAFVTLAMIPALGWGLATAEFKAVFGGLLAFTAITGVGYWAAGLTPADQPED